MAGSFATEHSSLMLNRKATSQHQQLRRGNNKIASSAQKNIHKERVRRIKDMLDSNYLN